MSRRPGLSRIEVVVLLLIVFVVAALVLSLARKAAEAAARMNCQNNLKQIGIATLHHHDATQSLPALTTLDPKTGANPGAPSMFWYLLPFIESGPRLYGLKQSTFEKYHAHSSVVFHFMGKDGQDLTQHGGDANQMYRPFLDPADATARDLRDVPMTLPDGSTGHYATGSYAANGLLPWGMKPQPNEPSVLSANLILFAERPQVCRTATGETVHNLWGVGFYSPHMPAFATLTPSEPAGLLSTGQLAAHADGVNPIQLITRSANCDPRLPGTPHRGGMQVAMGDGSVRVFSLSTDPQVFWAACAPPSR
jgi:prepilin-type processing-associated H-X9-DG protein